MTHCTHLPLNYSKTESPNILNVSVLWDDNDLILVDCGNPNSIDLLQDALRWNGLSLNKLTKVIITHHDYDHYGSLAELKEKYPHVQVYATQVESEYINGSKRSLRLVQTESIYPTLQDNQKEQAMAFHKKLESITPSNIDGILEPDTDYPWCGGITIVSTPGHMPGHISVYHKPTRTMITGDAMVIEHGKLETANPRYTLDNDKAYQSMKKFLNFEIERLICYHGGVMTQDIRENIEAL